VGGDIAGKPDYEERTPLSVFPCNMNFFFVNYIKYTVLADRDSDFMTCLELLDSFFCIPVHTVSSVYILVLISPMLSLAQGCSALLPSGLHHLDLPPHQGPSGLV
jgi:hypothetical protein